MHPTLLLVHPTFNVNGRKCPPYKFKRCTPINLHITRFVRASSSLFFPMSSFHLLSLCHWSFFFVVPFKLLLLHWLSTLRTCSFVGLFHRRGKLFLPVNGCLFVFGIVLSYGSTWSVLLIQINLIRMSHKDLVDPYDLYGSSWSVWPFLIQKNNK